MSKVFRIGRTTILWILKRFGPGLNIVASQLQKLVQKLDHEVVVKMNGIRDNKKVTGV